MRKVLKLAMLMTVSLVSLSATLPVTAQELGDVSTAFRWLGKNDRIAVEAYDDPKVIGVTCYVSRARTGGVKGTVGLAEDKAEASIACRQVAATVTFKGTVPQQEDVFSERMSILFKRLHIVRLVDVKRNTLVYLTYSDKLIDGSPMNAITAVPVAASTPIPVK
ncbi:CreA family protein [Herbaspirillum rhizosphaerae]|uniref:CreA family protein n=2 Tax=Herbaspirillum rhizosphaerae TaxID=346179 RepID=A0ABW8ZDA9_9BURK